MSYKNKSLKNIQNKDNKFNKGILNYLLVQKSLIILKVNNKKLKKLKKFVKKVKNNQVHHNILIFIMIHLKTI